MEISSIDAKIHVPLIGFAGVVAFLDAVVKDEYKKRLTDALTSIARMAQSPKTFGFYGLTVSVSLLFTAAILAVNGTLHTLFDHRDGALDSLKSLGPIAGAVVLKILIFDFVFALKSSMLVSSVQATLKPRSRAGNVTGAIVLCILDLLLTGWLTAILLNWLDLTRIDWGSDVQEQRFVQALTTFFDTVVLLLRASIERAIYVLNGSSIFYLALSFLWLHDQAFDPDKLKNWVFRIVAVLAFSLIEIVIWIYRLS